jgi:predicted short-subunit dehydrogenase-like oxidoreductase (DUF2520 family)
MKKSQPVGLVVEGNLTSSAILHLRSVMAELGPIKGRTNRLSRRASNFLRAGVPVSSYEELDDARVILIHVPDSSVAGVVQELSLAGLNFNSKVFLLCETWQSSDALAPLAGHGAATASSVVINTARNRWFVIEGSALATRVVRRLLNRDAARTIEINNGSKQLLFAAELLTGVLPITLLGRAEQALRSASISGNQLYALLEGITQRMFQDAANHRKSDTPLSVRGCPAEVAQAHLQRLRETDPDLAGYLAQQLTCAGFPGFLPLTLPANPEKDGEARLPNSK